MYLKGTQEAWYGIKNPQPGTWLVEIEKLDQIENPQISLHIFNEAPTFQFVSPQAKVTTDRQVTVRWSDEDPDDDATISFYYNTDKEGGNGTLITQGISEDNEEDAYNWDVSQVPNGIYYLFAVINDGKNAPQVVYANPPLEVRHEIGLRPPTGLKGTVLENSINLTWEKSPDKVAGYKLHYTDKLDEENYRAFVELPGDADSYTLKDLKPGTTYRIAITAFDEGGRESAFSNAVQLTTTQASVPKLTLDSDAIDFGTTDPEKAVSRSLTLRNEGTADLLVKDVKVLGSGAEAFVLENLTIPFSLGASQEKRIALTFKPPTWGQYYATLVINTNDPFRKDGSVLLPLKGTVPPLILTETATIPPTSFAGVAGPGKTANSPDVSQTLSTPTVGELAIDTTFKKGTQKVGIFVWVEIPAGGKFFIFFDPKGVLAADTKETAIVKGIIIPGDISVPLFGADIFGRPGLFGPAVPVKVLASVANGTWKFVIEIRDEKGAVVTTSTVVFTVE